MRMKIFRARNLKDLEAQVNQFLAENSVMPDTLKTNYHSTVVPNDMLHVVEHVLMLFYVPR